MLPSQTSSVIHIVTNNLHKLFYNEIFEEYNLRVIVHLSLFWHWASECDSE